jgi:hypothetical protein
MKYVLVLVGLLLILACIGPTASEVRAEVSALQFVTESPTFIFDGSELFVRDSYGSEYRARVSLIFTSAHGGYGNRAGQLVTQQITYHSVIVNLEGGEIVNAVMDDTWDMLIQEEVL